MDIATLSFKPGGGGGGGGVGKAGKILMYQTLIKSTINIYKVSEYLGQLQ